MKNLLEKRNTFVFYWIRWLCVGTFDITRIFNSIQFNSYFHILCKQLNKNRFWYFEIVKRDIWTNNILIVVIYSGPRPSPSPLCLSKKKNGIAMVSIRFVFFFSYFHFKVYKAELFSTSGWFRADNSLSTHLNTFAIRPSNEKKTNWNCWYWTSFDVADKRWSFFPKRRFIKR